jgi:hypothetical protein
VSRKYERYARPDLKSRLNTSVDAAKLLVRRIENEDVK